MRSIPILCIGLFVALLGYVGYRMIHNGPRPDEMHLFSLEKLAVNAKKKDPFACGQGLKFFIDSPKETERRTDFIRWCCIPPVEDMSGYIKQACNELLKVDPATLPEGP